MSIIDTLLKTLSIAPQTEIDKTITARLKGLIGGNDELVAAELADIIQLCKRNKLASTFSLNILEHALISVRGAK